MAKKINLGFIPVSVGDLAGKMPAPLVLLSGAVAVLWLLTVANAAHFIGFEEPFNNIFMAKVFVYVMVVTAVGVGAGYVISRYRRKLAERGVQKAVPELKKFLSRNGIHLSDASIAELLRTKELAYDDYWDGTTTLTLTSSSNDQYDSYCLTKWDGTPVLTRW